MDRESSMTRSLTTALAALITAVATLGFGAPVFGQAIRLARYDVSNCSSNVNENGYGPQSVASGFTFSSMTLNGVGTGSFTGHYHTTGWSSSLNTGKYIILHRRTEQPGDPV